MSHTEMTFKATLATLAKAARKYKWHLALVAALGLAYWLWCRRSSNREPFFNSLKDAVAKVVAPGSIPVTTSKPRSKMNNVCGGNRYKNHVAVGPDGKCPSGHLDTGDNGPLFASRRCVQCMTPEESAEAQKKFDKSQAEFKESRRIGAEKAKAQCPEGGFGYKPKTEGKCINQEVLIDGYCIRCRTPEEKAKSEVSKKAIEILRSTRDKCGGKEKTSLAARVQGACPPGYTDTGMGDSPSGSRNILQCIKCK